MTAHDSLDDQALARRARDGDEQAFRALADRHSARLLARIRQRLHPAFNRKVAASDILQEAYLAAFRRLGDFEDRGDGSFGRWRAGIVERKVREAVRRFAAGGRRAVGRELLETVREAIRTLPEDQRAVLVLLPEEHLSLEEAAVRMGRSKDAVKMLYSRALASLEARLELEPGHERRRPTR